MIMFVFVFMFLNFIEMQKEEVDEIVLVGGSTRIPKVKQMLK
jgi:molecular chaperone DnaK (HSP70)